MKAKKAKKAKLAYSIDEHLVRFHEKAARAALKLADRYLKGSMLIRLPHTGTRC